MALNNTPLSRAAILTFIAMGILPACATESPTYIPFRLDDNLVHIQAWVNGHPTEAGLDSGTGAIIIDQQFARTLGIKSGKAIGQAFGGGTGAQTMFPTTLDTVVWGPITLKHQAAIVLDNRHPTSSAGFPVQALLGREFFADQAITIDYPARRVIVYPAGNAPFCRTPIPFDLDFGVPVVNASISIGMRPAQQVQLVVDLGTRHYPAMLGAAFLSTPGGQTLVTTGQATQVGTGSGGPVMGIRGKALELKVGNHVLHNVDVAATKQVKAFFVGN